MQKAIKSTINNTPIFIIDVDIIEHTIQGTTFKLGSGDSSVSVKWGGSWHIICNFSLSMTHTMDPILVVSSHFQIYPQFSFYSIQGLKCIQEENL